MIVIVMVTALVGTDNSQRVLFVIGCVRYRVCLRLFTFEE